MVKTEKKRTNLQIAWYLQKACRKQSYRIEGIEKKEERTGYKYSKFLTPIKANKLFQIVKTHDLSENRHQQGSWCKGFELLLYSRTRAVDA